MYALLTIDGYCNGYSYRYGYPERSVYISLGDVLAARYYGQLYKDGVWINEFDEEILKIPIDFRLSVDEKLDLILTLLCSKDVKIELGIKPEEIINAVGTGAITEAKDGEEWRSGIHYSNGTIVSYKTIKYVVRDGKSHISQAGWEPTLTPDLFEKINEDYTEWSQPGGSYNAYMTGDKVSYNGFHYVSMVDANVYAPGIVPGQWEQIQ